MNTNELLNIVKSRFAACLDIMDNRAMQYSFENDRLHNFKEGSKIVGLTPEFYGFCLMNKQLTSLIDIVKERQIYNKEVFEEKLNDVHNYLYLIEALMKVKHQATISEEAEILTSKLNEFKNPEPSVNIGSELW